LPACTLRDRRYSVRLDRILLELNPCSNHHSSEFDHVRDRGVAGSRCCPEGRRIERGDQLAPGQLDDVVEIRITGHALSRWRHLRAQALDQAARLASPAIPY